eukprot:1066486-Prymnesium_polylepis.1
MHSDHALDVMWDDVCGRKGAWTHLWSRAASLSETRDHMWVPRGGDLLTHPGRYGAKERDQTPRDFSLPFRVTADGAPA